MWKAFLLLCVLLTTSYTDFIETSDGFSPYLNDPRALIVASPGRSGSTLLTKSLAKAAGSRTVLKTHQFVSSAFKGKVLFIFSQPDRATESALRKLLKDPQFSYLHFQHIFTSDKAWFGKNSEEARRQTLEHNLLAYDALGTTLHLQRWLLDWARPSSPKTAQILAIKYEHLWDIATQKAIQTFCGLDHLELPPRKERGCKERNLSSLERTLRKASNKQNKSPPEYPAYDQAREIWEKAPPFQYLSY